jgi:hypothetical protein
MSPPSPNYANPLPPARAAESAESGGGGPFRGFCGYCGDFDARTATCQHLAARSSSRPLPRCWHRPGGTTTTPSARSARRRDTGSATVARSSLSLQSGRRSQQPDCRGSGQGAAPFVQLRVVLRRVQCVHHAETPIRTQEGAASAPSWQSTSPGCSTGVTWSLDPGLMTVNERPAARNRTGALAYPRWLPSGRTAGRPALMAAASSSRVAAAGLTRTARRAVARTCRICRVGRPAWLRATPRTMASACAFRWRLSCALTAGVRSCRGPYTGAC